MSWKINYTKHAREDLKTIYEYIAYELFVPDTAGRQVDRIMKAVRTLAHMPERHKVYEEEPWKSQNLRYFPVDNYHTGRRLIKPASDFLPSGIPYNAGKLPAVLQFHPDSVQNTRQAPASLTQMRQRIPWEP